MKKRLFLIILVVFGGLLTHTNTSHADVTVYTPYTGLSVTPGEDIEYTVDIINNGNSIENVTFDMQGLPDEWDYSISANGTNLQQLSIRPGSEEDIRVVVTVPLKVDKGEYQFNLVANGNGENEETLPFLVNVSEEGTFKTNFSMEQRNMQGHSDSEFSYNATLKNQTAEQQHYALGAKAPKGWNVQFTADGKGVTSVTLEPSEEKNIEVKVTPAENAKAETYTIPITAASGATSSNLEIEAVITGTYGIALTTPDGKLSDDITSGGKKNIELVIENTGTTDLTEIDLKATTPPDWETEFDKDTIPTLQAGEKATVKATLSAPNNSIAGDYVTTFTAQTPEATSYATFRMSVKTSTLWGLVGVAIIIAVIGVLYLIYRKYGRR
ncbi:NEW3 domain-containing protein [Ornithinibacillus salinisoli]|uniref:NEW3 domain-containing protein n=1 Tax=Ornithinibacillus salinisoli TaxID=1848459 RepID=A0ABW4VW67_9BACI